MVYACIFFKRCAYQYKAVIKHKQAVLGGQVVKQAESGLVFFFFADGRTNELASDQGGSLFF